jgi:glucose/arabinose dehydrogenase
LRRVDARRRVGNQSPSSAPRPLAPNLGSSFGRCFAIDRTGSNSVNKKYGIPAANPFRNTTGALSEIYAYGVRNPQRFGWDQQTGRMFLADIGQNIVKEISNSFFAASYRTLLFP